MVARWAMGLLRVRNPPSKPLLIWDGGCHFCGLWVERWREITRDAVDYLTSQEVAERFPEVPRAQFGKSVVLVLPDGRAFIGAEAVFNSLGQRASWRWPLALYRHVPGFAAVTEFVYKCIAQHRVAASRVTRLLWGNDVRQPTYFSSRRWFLRALAVIYFIAFASLWPQLIGLIGRNGILPVARYLGAASEQLGASAAMQLPTLCWINSSDGFFHFLCAAGAGLSVLLFAELAPALVLAGLFALYLSLTIAGQTFLSFQWDVLLLETGFLAIFFAPLQWWPTRTRTPPVSRVGMFLLKALLFKLMIMSAVVKLTSGDGAWWDLSALNFHYETQPLPTPLAWWAHASPAWLKQISTLAMYFVELVAPCLIWGPRHLRLAAGTLLFGLQFAIAATGNYGFFNLLTAALCLLVIDDELWAFGRMRKWLAVIPGDTSRVGNSYHRVSRALAIGVLLITLPINAAHLTSAFKPEMEWPRPLAATYGLIAPFRIANGYGLFRVMTKVRPEISVEGSMDGATWQTYEFRWKPGSLSRRPPLIAPYQPRLDWQMWFAALGDISDNRWFLRFAECLLRNNPEVTALLAHNPFPHAPPRYLRARRSIYRFTTAAEYRSTGHYWSRAGDEEYLPAVSLTEFSPE